MALTGSLPGVSGNMAENQECSPDHYHECSISDDENESNRLIPLNIMSKHVFLGSWNHVLNHLQIDAGLSLTSRGVQGPYQRPEIQRDTTKGKRGYFYSCHARQAGRVTPKPGPLSRHFCDIVRQCLSPGQRLLGLHFYDLMTSNRNRVIVASIG